MQTPTGRIDPDFVPDGGPLFPTVELDTNRLSSNFASETQPRDNTPSMLTIACGVALGILAASAIRYAYLEWKIHQAAAAVTTQLRLVAERSHADLVRQQQLQAAREAARQQTAAINARELAAQQRQAETNKRALETAAAAKQQAWSRYYRTPERCINDPSSSMLVQCANEHIRAKRDFETKYDAGRL